MFTIPAMTTEQYAEAWCVLNCWDWPEVIPGKPTDWKTLPTDQKEKVLDPLMVCLKERIADRETLRAWHKRFNLTTAPGAFEAWYKKHIEG